MTTSFDAIVIGAGVIGSCVGLELARKGLRTLNIDKLPAAGYGSTSTSCAIIRTHYSTLEGTAMAYEALHYWREWPDYLGVEDERGLARYRNTGCLVFRTETNDYLRAICANLDAIGIPWEDWDLDRVRRKLPIYELARFAPVRQRNDPDFGRSSDEAVAGAVMFPDAGYVSDPQLATHNVQRAAEAAGGIFRFNAEVAEIRAERGRVAGVTLAGGERIDAPVMVNVAGPHSAHINRMAGVEDGMNIKTRALRQEVAHVDAPGGFDFERGGCVVSDGDIGCYSRPESGNHILVGSEDPACDEHQWVDPDDFDENLSERAMTQIYRLAQRIPKLGIPNSPKGVVGLYDASDDWIPIYDKSDLPGFYMAVGSSGNQFKNAPVAGLLMAALIEACENGREHDTDPLPFEMRYTGRTLNAGFFSRRREINRESSFSVLG
jgi:sarcosine oxidase subunit beta